jgi:purine-cytosine permease-like protein
VNEDGYRVSRSEVGVRLGCGALAGIVFGGLVAIRETGGDVWLTIKIAGATAVVTGALAAAYGDRFWHKLSRVLWWFGPGSR